MVNNGSNSKSFERKNSFLSKLFSSSNSNGGSPASKKSTSTSAPSGGQNGNKPILATFSAQFPPSELQLQVKRFLYLETKKKPIYTYVFLHIMNQLERLSPLLEHSTIMTLILILVNVNLIPKGNKNEAKSFIK